jgi:hypothetical protein
MPRMPVSDEALAFALGLWETSSAVSLEAVLDAPRSCGQSLPKDASAILHALVDLLAVVSCSSAEQSQPSAGGLRLALPLHAWRFPPPTSIATSRPLTPARHERSAPPTLVCAHSCLQNPKS